MDVIPLQPVPSQILAVTLGTQLCQLNVYQKSTGLYMDVFAAGNLILAGVICENLNRIVRDQHFGFVGDLVFIDTGGTSDPTYTGLGDRYVLCYLDAADLLQVDQGA